MNHPAADCYAGMEGYFAHYNFWNEVADTLRLRELDTAHEPVQPVRFLFSLRSAFPQVRLAFLLSCGVAFLLTPERLLYASTQQLAADV